MSNGIALIIPPMKYDISRVSAYHVNCHIMGLYAVCAQQFEGVRPGKTPMHLFHENVLSNPNRIWYFGYIPAPPNEFIARQVVGKDGFFFKKTTYTWDIDFIWHDRTNNVFLFWGEDKFNLIKAMDSIRWRIYKLYQQNRNNFDAQRQQIQHEQQNIEDISDDEEMTESISQGNTPDEESSLIY
jgi:hypothetical protein